MTDDNSTREDLLARITQLEGELCEARMLLDGATRFEFLVPEDGGTELIVARQTVAFGPGWAASKRRPGGGLSWTAEGWQPNISALSVDRLFCWPDPLTALTQARNALSADA